MNRCGWDKNISSMVYLYINHVNYGKLACEKHPILFISLYFVIGYTFGWGLIWINLESLMLLMFDVWFFGLILVNKRKSRIFLRLLKLVLPKVMVPQSPQLGYSFNTTKGHVICWVRSIVTTLDSNGCRLPWTQPLELDITWHGIIFSKES